MEVVEVVAGLRECEPVLVTVLVALRRNTVMKEGLFGLKT